MGAVVGDGEGIVDKATGITVRAQGLNSMGAVADAFFDSKNAGLGVCSSASCKSGVPGAFTGDDNLNRAEEGLLFTFNRAVRIQGLTIRDANHLQPTGDFLIGGETFTITNGVVSAALLALIAPASSFELEYVEGGPEIYVGDFTVAAVPLPAGALLLGTALAGARRGGTAAACRRLTGPRNAKRLRAGPKHPARLLSPQPGLDPGGLHGASVRAAGGIAGAQRGTDGQR